MSQSLPDKYSIKQRLAYILSTPTTPLPSTPKIAPNQGILKPQHYDYFLNTVDKEIKHEGDLLTRIQRTIQTKQPQKSGQKDPYNEVKNISHNALINSFAKRSHNRNKTAQAQNHNQAEKLYAANTRCVSSASGSFRNTLKMKASSLSTQFPKKIANSRCFNRNLSNILLKQKTQLKKQYGKPWQQGQNYHKKSKTGIEMSVMGSSPQWQNFQCYRNNGVSLVKKWFD